MTGLPHGYRTRASLREDLRRLGVAAGDIVIVHAAMRRVGPLLNGPDALIGALLDATAPGGTVAAYTDWDAVHEQWLDGHGRVPAPWRDHVPPFDPLASRAARSHGVLAEFIRTTPGARRSGNPGASVAAVGAAAGWLTADHPLDYGYGEGSPFAKLVHARAKVLMAGAPLDTMSLLHHAEHLAAIPGKRVRRHEVPLSDGAEGRWRMIEEFETSEPVVVGLADDYFGRIVTEYLESGRGARGTVGDAPSVLVDAADICAFAVAWLERHAMRPRD
ncbi:MAG TPA: aminoglycoside 3-N-acetyltransferase [Burkholderiaceae bacterium]|nr:aminoglycoside 3-N-acetyltransferase [Burkholderiaceae bacterium]